VRAISLDPRKAECDASWILRAALHFVERDLDDELRAHVYDVSLAANFAREQLLRLPCQELVRHSLERLAQHDEVARRRIARAEMQVAQPSLPPSRAPLDGKHDEIQRLRGFHLEPRGAAPR